MPLSLNDAPGWTVYHNNVILYILSLGLLKNIINNCVLNHVYRSTKNITLNLKFDASSTVLNTSTKR